MRRFEKIFFDPSYVPMLFFEAAPGRARTIEKFFFASFAFFTFKLNYCRVTGPQNKIFNKNKLTLICIHLEGTYCSVQSFWGGKVTTTGKNVVFFPGRFLWPGETTRRDKKKFERPMNRRQIREPLKKEGRFSGTFMYWKNVIICQII
jgi:hypothetical protein